MDEYKKGILILKKKQQKYSFRVSVCSGVICDYCKEFYEFYEKLPKEKQLILDKAFRNVKGNIEDLQAKELLSEYCKDEIIKIKRYPIIYTEYFDSNGNRYGKELLTGKVFPIPKEVKDEFTITKTTKRNGLFHGDGSIAKNNIFYDCGINEDGRHIFKDINGKSYRAEYYSLRDYNTLSNMYDPSKKIGSIEKAPIICYSISKSLEYVHDNANRLEVVLEACDFANQQEVDSYHARNIIVKHISRKVKKLFNLNIFENDNFHLFNVNGTSNILLLIDNCESLLREIKNINKGLYLEASSEYQSIINENNVETNRLNELRDFYEKYSKKINLSSNDNEACEFLDGLIATVMEDEKNATSIAFLTYLTNLHETFINNEKKYSVKSLQEINFRFNLLYFLYLYNNRDSINKTELSFSHIESFVKGIVNVIAKLIEEGSVVYINDSNYNFRNMSLDDLISLIKNLQINKIDDVKELIKF